MGVLGETLFALLGSTWEVSVASGKYLLLLLLIAGFLLYLRNKEGKFNLFKALQYAFRSLLLCVGPFLVFGLVFSGVLNFFIHHLSISIIPLIISGAYSYFKLDKIKEQAILKNKDKVVFSVFSSVLLICLIFSLTLNTVLMNSIMALFFYGILFWEL